MLVPSRVEGFDIPTLFAPLLPFYFLLLPCPSCLLPFPKFTALTAWANELPTLPLIYILPDMGSRYISQRVGPLRGMVISLLTSNPWRW